MSEQSPQIISIEFLDKKNQPEIFLNTIHAKEALSHSFELEARIIANAELDVSDLLGSKAKVQLEIVEEKTSFYGIVSSISILDRLDNKSYFYQLTLVPEFKLLDYSGQNQVYATDGKSTIVDILKDELAATSKKKSRPGESAAHRNIEADMRPVSSDYAKLDFVMQYRESDFNFINRQCERFGIFYMFDHSDNGQGKIVFGDKNENFSKITGKNIDSNLTYHHESQSVGEGTLAVRSFTAIYNLASSHIRLQDYNPDNPELDLGVVKDTSLANQGTRVLYGENYKDKASGETIAQIRSQQVSAERVQFSGVSNIPLIRPGFIFDLIGCSTRKLEQKYIVIEVEHKIVQPTPVGFGGSKETSPYRNYFKCIPYSTPFRPAMVTPKPVVNGFLLGVIEGSSSAKRAELDDQGRYRIRLLDDESKLEGQSAIQHIRKIEPYGGGDGLGAHATLTVGTEVLIGFVNGDPDRPLVLGSLSNGKKTNPVVQGNQQVAFRMKTPSGVVVQICDGKS